jgi:energy-coupling factor transporter ATP-binding protein EcfA2
VEKFNETPKNGINTDIFNLIKQEYPDIENAGLNNNTLRIKSDGIPTVLELRLEEEHEFGDAQPDIVGYKLVIETYSDLRFGYRTFESVEKFENMSESIANIVQTNCFTGQHPSQSFVLTKLKEDIPSGIENIEDEELNISAQIQDSTMEMTFRSPQHLTKGIRKYFRPS